MPAFRLAVILIGITVMMHSGVMMGPHAPYANGYDPAHDTVLALVCDETEGVPFATRLSGDPSVLAASAHQPDAPIDDTDEGVVRTWIAPIITADTLRALLQVFLN